MLPMRLSWSLKITERLGLSQLHQLRGRIGRGEHPSICILLYKKPLSPIAKERLAVIRETSDGFLIAEKDLKLRGPGELLGTKQKGLIGLRIADVMRDAYLLPMVNQLSSVLEDKHPKSTKKLLSVGLEISLSIVKFNLWLHYSLLNHRNEF